jgi:hypothetical protein
MTRAAVAIASLWLPASASGMGATSPSSMGEVGSVDGRPWPCSSVDDSLGPACGAGCPALLPLGPSGGWLTVLAN